MLKVLDFKTNDHEITVVYMKGLLRQRIKLDGYGSLVSRFGIEIDPQDTLYCIDRDGNPICDESDNYDQEIVKKRLEILVRNKLAVRAAA